MSWSKSTDPCWSCTLPTEAEITAAKVSGGSVWTCPDCLTRWRLRWSADGGWAGWDWERVGR